MYAAERETTDKHDTVGRYRLIEELGRGAQGVVWLGEDEELGRRVAVKILGGDERDDAAIRRFRREARAASRVVHPGLCPVLDAGVDGGRRFIVMPFLEGETLADRLRRHDGVIESDTSVFVDISDDVELPAEPDSDRRRDTRAPTSVDTITATTLEIAAAARALHAAHEAGVVHRDIKPGNIMVTADGPVILDFGLADDERESHDITRPGDRFGTPAYMAPEQIDEGVVDRRTDVYALGATLYECLTHVRPFRATSLQKLYRSILLDDPESPRALNPEIGEDLAAVVLSALARDPADRPATALELAEELERVVTHRLVTRTTRIGRVAGAVRRRLRAAASVLVVAVVALAGWTVSGDDGELASLRVQLEEEREARRAAEERLDREKVVRSTMIDVFDSVMRKARLDVRQVAKPKRRVWYMKAPENCRI